MTTHEIFRPNAGWQSKLAFASDRAAKFYARNLYMQRSFRTCDLCGRNVGTPLRLERDHLCLGCYDICYLDVGVGG